jgi:thioredoxin-related protein
LSRPTSDKGEDAGPIDRQEGRAVRTYCFVQIRNLLAVAFLIVAAVPSAGQEIHWCRDYRTAWEEAHATGRPLLLDFGTESCFWCKKLDATTFRDPAIVETVNDGFVALHVDANREPVLVRTLRIKSFPTLVLAGPDGAVLGRVIGYTDAARFKQRLQEVLARIPASDQPLRDYQEAAAAIAQPNYPRAIALLQKVLADGGHQPVQLKARALLQEFEQQAADRLRCGRELQQKGQLAEASTLLDDLARTYAGTAAAHEAGLLLLSARAR